LSTQRLGLERGRNTSRPTKNSPTETAMRSFMCIHRSILQCRGARWDLRIAVADTTQGHGQGSACERRQPDARSPNEPHWRETLGYAPCPRSYPQKLGEQFYTDAGKRLAQAAESGALRICRRTASARSPRSAVLGPTGLVDCCCVRVCVIEPRVPTTWGSFLNCAT
jgi:hypothetical protein